MGYKEDLTIDKFSLPEEWERQPQLYMQWAEAHALAMDEVSRAKEQLDLVKAELDEQIRVDPERFGFDKKPTEAAISACIVKQTIYNDAYKHYLEKNKSSNILAGAKEAMNHKKKALEGLTQLLLGGFYAIPKIPEAIKQERSNEVAEGVRKTLRRKQSR